MIHTLIRKMGKTYHVIQAEIKPNRPIKGLSIRKFRSKRKVMDYEKTR